MPTKDRLPELLQVAGERPQPTEPPPETDPRIERLYHQVCEVRRLVGEVSAGAERVRRLHSHPAFHTSEELQAQLEAAVSAAQAAATGAAGALRALQPLTEGGGAVGRMARLQRAAAHAHYDSALAALHHALRGLRDERLQLLQRQLHLTNLTMSEEECESLLDSKNLSMFVDNLTAETAEARRALCDAEARHHELRQLEAALADVRDLFTHLAALVSVQQDQIDSVEYYALQATEHVELGQQQLLRGTVSKTSARKKKMCLVLCLATGAAVVLMVLVLT